MSVIKYEIRGPGPEIVYIGQKEGMWHIGEPMPVDGPEWARMPERERRMCIALLELALENLRQADERN